MFLKLRINQCIHFNVCYILTRRRKFSRRTTVHLSLSCTERYSYFHGSSVWWFEPSREHMATSSRPDLRLSKSTTELELFVVVLYWVS